MLVRLGPPSANLARVAGSGRAPRALPGGRTPVGAEPKRTAEPDYAAEEASTRFDQTQAQRACAAYRATDLVQPRPGLYLHVEA